MEEGELGVRQIDHVAAQMDLMPTGMDDEIVDLDGRFEIRMPLRLAPPEQRFDPRGEHAGAEGFGDVVVGTPLESGDHIALLALGGEHHDGDLARPRIGLETTADLESVEAGEHEVEHHQVWWLAADSLEGLLAVDDPEDVIPVADEVESHQFEEILLVIDNEDPRLVRHRTAPPFEWILLHANTTLIRAIPGLPTGRHPCLRCADCVNSHRYHLTTPGFAALSADFTHRGAGPSLDFRESSGRQERSNSTSSGVSVEIMFSSARTIDSARSRLRSWRARIFSSTVSRAMRR